MWTVNPSLSSLTAQLRLYRNSDTHSLRYVIVLNFSLLTFKAF